MTADQRFVARAHVPAGVAAPLAQLAAQLGPGPFSLVLLFISPDCDLPSLAAASQGAFPCRLVAGCTTAGELSGDGYDSGGIVAIGFPERHFAAQALVLRGLSRASGAELSDALLEMRQRLAGEHGLLPVEFAVLLVDGLSIREDELASALAAGAGAMPLVGGSAGDGTRFAETFVLFDGRLHQDAAVLCTLRSDCALRPFSLDHLEPTPSRMVVTDADPATRTVRRINAEPAAREYARMVGRDVAQLDTSIFAANPLAVRMGPRHHIRAIQRVMPSGELVFYSAIDEGVVLSLAQPMDMATHLDRELTGLANPVAPVAILAFDCILRRIESEERQMAGRMAEVFRRHGVSGFNTYGEQVGPLHLNQTISGFAFYPPGTDLHEAQG